MKNKANSKLSPDALNDAQVELKILLTNFYKALDNMIEAKIKTILKESDLLQLVPAEVSKTNKSSMWAIADTGEISIQIPNKSDSIISKGDSVILANRYGSNLRNSFLLCRNGQEIPLEKIFLDKYNDLQSQIDKLNEVVSGG